MEADDGRHDYVECASGRNDHAYIDVRPVTAPCSEIGPTCVGDECFLKKTHTKIKHDEMMDTVERSMPNSEANGTMYLQRAPSDEAETTLAKRRG